MGFVRRGVMVTCRRWRRQLTTIFERGEAMGMCTIGKRVARYMRQREVMGSMRGGEVVGGMRWREAAGSTRWRLREGGEA